jgi:hypothetical protein
MPTQAPEETDVLCEDCGYMLNGLPESGRCPECGSEIELSVSQRFRQTPPWEVIGHSSPKWLRFVVTTLEIIFHPKRFYRGSTSRGQVSPAKNFAQIHWITSSILFGLAGFLHWQTEKKLQNLHTPDWTGPLVLLGLPILIYLTTVLVIGLAARLTTWEAAYRGYRLPGNVVLRALYYHSAHLLPVALLLFATCGTTWLLYWRWIPTSTPETIYLYILCGEVILSAGYLFNTYWIGMRNWMYANR